jgi:D-alanyl-D-alanine-carboxypeptidase/D-alanyl-D-alanine-endopeptidase
MGEITFDSMPSFLCCSLSKIQTPFRIGILNNELIIHPCRKKMKVSSNNMLFFRSFTILFALTIALSGIPTITTVAAASSTTKSSSSIASSSPTFEITDNLKQLIRTVVDNNKTNAAIVIGLVDANGTQFYGYGKTSNASNATTVNENTLFDIGSITKTFTTIILANMVEQGIVNLDDPIEKYLPPTVKVPTYNGNKITLKDLATHTSGLPDYPPNLQVSNITTYPNYTREQLYQALSNVTLTETPGSNYSYSDMGMALLGDMLASKAGMPYEQLVIDKILNVLGMNSTRITLSDSILLSRLALGHVNGTEIPITSVSFVNPPPLAPAGSLRTSASDMVKYLSANIGLIKTILDDAMQDSHKIRLYTNQSIRGYDVYVGLGWFTTTNFGSQIIWHNGGVYGYNAFAGFNPTTQRGVVILASTMIQDIPVAYVGFGPLNKFSTMIWNLLSN